MRLQSEHGSLLPDRARILPPRKRQPPLNGGGQVPGRWSLIIAILMVSLLLGSALPGLPVPAQHLSPALPAHASLSFGEAGEGPFFETRTAYANAAFLDIRPRETRFGGPPGEAGSLTFDIRELNNVDASITSFTWRFTTLDDKEVVDGGATVPMSIELEGLGRTEWTTSITISSRLYREMILQGRDQLRLALTFRGTDANSNELTTSHTIPADLLQRVAMLVDEDVFPLIEDRLLRFEDDANLRGSVEFIHRTGNWGSAEAIRALLKLLWSDEAITGAILWGHLPFAMWDMVHSDDSHEIFPIPVFYEDMDGSFVDTNGDGLYDKHLWGENDGCEIWTSFVMPPRELVPEENLDPSGLGTGGGLSAAYYNNRNLLNWRMNRVDPVLDFYWLDDLPKEIDDDDFSIKWTGRIRADATETYTLSPLHGGGLRIWIDGDLAHDYWSGTTWKKWEHMSTVHMTKGWHNIRIEYNNNNWGFDGAVRLLWTSDHVLAGTLNDWLDRSHAYHQGALEYNEEALLFMDYGYGIKYRMRDPILERHIEPLYGDNVVVKGCTNTTSGDDYIEALEDGYELISVWSHAGSASHWISSEDLPEDANGSAPSYKIRETQAGLVTLIWGCHAGDFGGGHEGEGVSFLSDNLAANYAFSTPYGLACAAATRSIGTTFKEVYWAWDNGSSLATGFLANLDVEYDKATIERTAPNLAEDMWVKEEVLMGDPFIRIDHRPWNTTLCIDGGADFTDDINVTLRVSSVDAVEMRFKDAGGEWTAWEAFCSTREWELGPLYGAHKVFVQTRNGWGTAEYQASDVITLVATMIDSFSVSINGGAGSSNSTQVSVALDAGSADPGLLWMSTRDDSSEWNDWTPFLNSFDWRLSSGDGERSLTVRLMSEEGIWRSEATDDIMIDTHPPRTEVHPEGQLGAMDWYLTPVTLTLNATDAVTGVAGTEWSLDGGAWTTYEAPVQVSGDGGHTLRYRSSDLCGNTEAAVTLDIKLDTTAPEGLTLATASGGCHLSIPSMDLEMAASDPHSGLDSMRFRIDGGDWGPWTNFETSRYVTIPSVEGEHTMEWQVRDVAGNVATLSEPLTVILDVTAPLVESQHPVKGASEVPVDTMVSVLFSEPVDASTVTQMNFLVQDASGIPVAGAITVDPDTGEFVFTPDEALQYLATYSVMLRGSILDQAGNGLVDGAGTGWTFTTVGLPPGAAEGLNAEATNESILLSWNSPVTTGTGDLVGFNVYRMRDGTDQDFQLIGTVPSTSYVDTDVEQLALYHYMVRAVTSYTEGPDSAVVSGTVVPTFDEPEDPEDTAGPDPNDNSGDGDGGTSHAPTGTYALIGILVAVVAAVIVGMLYKRH